MKVLLSALFFLLASMSNSFAEELRYYDVEIIIIENLSPEAKASEHWPLEVNINKPVNTVELGMAPPTEWLPIDADFSISFKELLPEEYQLNAEVEKISRSNSRRVIFHRGWRQPGLDKKIAMPVYFKYEITDTPLDSAAPVQAAVQQNNTEAGNENTDTTPVESTSQSNLPTLEGLFRVTLSRYLHLEAELIYRDKPPLVAMADNIEDSENFNNESTESTTAEEEKQGVIYLKETRHRMKSNELHYIDHPVLGILVKITPYLKPEVEEATIKSGLNKP